MKFFIVQCLLCLAFCISAQNDSYQIELNLNTDTDFIEVSVYPPEIDEYQAFYTIPLSSLSGNRLQLTDYISDLKILDDDGSELKHNWLPPNQIRIEKGSRIKSLHYKVHQPKRNRLKTSTTSLVIERNEIYLLNHHFYSGYFANSVNNAYEVLVIHPPHLKPANEVERINDSSFKLSFESFNELISTPLLIAKTESTSFPIGLNRFSLSVYSENKNVTLQKVQGILEPLITDISQSLPQNIHLKDFNFVFYFAEIREPSEYNFGGLVHGGNTFFVLPATDNGQTLSRMVKRIAAHEFLHIICPHNLSSHKIHELQHTRRASTEHLWLYEGVTEYLSLLLLHQLGHMTTNEFKMELGKKVRLTKEYPKVSLKEASINAFKKKFLKHRNNFYYKGALMALCLDIELRDTGITLLELLSKLTKHYGGEPFDELSLIPTISKLTGKNFDPFFTEHFISKKPVDYSKYLNKIGLHYYEEKKVKEGTFGIFFLDIDYQLNKYRFHHIDRNEIGLKNDDVLLKIEGEAVNYQNYSRLLNQLYYPQPGDSLNLLVERRGQPTQLFGSAGFSWNKLTHIVDEAENTTEKAVRLREMYLTRKEKAE